MRSILKDKKGVSPVIGVILMIGVTITLAGSVYIMAGTYIGMAEGEPEIVNVEVDIVADGISEYSEENTVVHRYSGVKIDIISGIFDWGNYKVLVNSKRVFTVPSNVVPVGSVPDASTDPGPTNFGRSQAGEHQWFTENGYREDFMPMKTGTPYNVKIINIQTNQLVWENDIESTR